MILLCPNSATVVGFLVIGLWVLKIALALLLNFRHSVASPFFWSAVVSLLILGA